MRTTTVAAALAALFAFAGSPAAADETKVGIAVGAALPAYGIGGPPDSALAVSVWLARPIRGPYEWRAEFGGQRFQMPDGIRFRCSAASFFCDSNLGVTFVGGGLQLEPWAGNEIAPYGYLTIGLYHVTADAEVEDVRQGTIQTSTAWIDNAFGLAIGFGVRVRLGGRWALRAELRYSGFSYEPGTVNWASLITPALNVSVRF